MDVPQGAPETIQVPCPICRAEVTCCTVGVTMSNCPNCGLGIVYDDTVPGPIDPPPPLTD